MKKFFKILTIAILAPVGVSMAQETDLTISQPITYGNTRHEKAVEKITASNTVEAQAKVQYEAGKAVIMKPGFVAEKGTSFKAYINKVDRVEGYKESNVISLSATPNPFPVETEIEYFLPEAGKVSLVVNSFTGIPVATLVNDEYQEAGTHKAKFNGQNVVAGTYLYTIKTDRSVISKKLTKQ
jgi:hypothetical protein